MTQTLMQFDNEAIATGIFPGQEPEAPALWHDCENVTFAKGRVLPAIGVERLVSRLKVIEIAQGWAPEDRARAYFQDEIFRIMKWEDSSVQRNLGIMDRRATLLPVGKFLFVGARNNRVRVWRDGGSLEIIPGAPRSRLLLLSNQHIVGFGDYQQTSDNTGQEFMHWCSASDFDTWGDERNNSAGFIPVREMRGEFEAAKKIDQRILAYTPEEVISFQWQGGNFTFREVGRLNGVGVRGKNCVVEAGFQNYGFNRNGIFITDGTKFEYVDDKAFMKLISAEVRWNQSDEITGFHDKENEEVQWHYNTDGGERKGVGFNYRTGAFTRYKLPIYAASARDVFDYPLLGTDFGLNYARGKTTVRSFLRSKALRVAPNTFAFWEAIRALGTFKNCWVRIGLHKMEGEDPHWVYEDRFYNLAILKPGFQESPWITIEFYTEDGGWMDFSQLQLLGEPSGPAPS